MPIDKFTKKSMEAIKNMEKIAMNNGNSEFREVSVDQADSYRDGCLLALRGTYDFLVLDMALPAHTLFEGKNEIITRDEYIEKDDLYIELEHEIFDVYDSYLRGTNIRLSDAQGIKITEKLNEYLMEVWQAKGKADLNYVNDIINDIMLNG